MLRLSCGTCESFACKPSSSEVCHICSPRAVLGCHRLDPLAAAPMTSHMMLAVSSGRICQLAGRGSAVQRCPGVVCNPLPLVGWRVVACLPLSASAGFGEVSHCRRTALRTLLACCITRGVASLRAARIACIHCASAHLYCSMRCRLYVLARPLPCFSVARAQHSAGCHALVLAHLLSSCSSAGFWPRLVKIGGPPGLRQLAAAIALTALASLASAYGVVASRPLPARDVVLPRLGRGTMSSALV